MGSAAEANPLIAWLLSIHVAAAAGVMLAMASVAALAYASIADWLDLSATYAFVVSTLGVLVAVTNLVVVFTSM